MSKLSLTQVCTLCNTRDMVATQKIRTVFYASPSDREALEKISEKTGAPVAELIRRAVAEWLEKQRRKGDK